MIGTLYHRAKTICSSPQHLQKEEKPLSQALRRCKYKTWAINRVRLRSQAPAMKKNKESTNNSGPNHSSNQKPHIVVPYHQGLSERIKRTCNKYGVQVHLKGGLAIKNLLMAPKDKDSILKNSGVTYRYKCDRVECDEEYIGVSARNFVERFKEHLKPPSPIHDHFNTSGHTVTIDNFSIVGREDQNLIRTSLLFCIMLLLLSNKWENFLTCLSLTLLNLTPLTSSMNLLHLSRSPALVTKDASFALLLFTLLPLSSIVLLIHLTLSCSNCLSAFSMIFPVP